VFDAEKVEAAVKVVNVVASATLGQRVDIDAVVKGFPSTEFPSKRFPGIVFRLKKPKTATLIFRSGKMICTGGKSEDEAREAVESVVRELGKGGAVIPKRSEVKINNIVASASLRRAVDLESASVLQGTMYEPDQFPGLIYRMDDPKVVFLIFSTGRLVCVGAKSEKEVRQAIKGLIQRLDAISPYKSSPFPRPNVSGETKRVKYIPVSRIKLRDYAFSDLEGKACVYVCGLWCHNEFCNGPSCKFANLVQRRLVDGLYGCWGFHWLKKSQRKFNN